MRGKTSRQQHQTSDQARRESAPADHDSASAPTNAAPLAYRQVSAGCLSPTNLHMLQQTDGNHAVQRLTVTRTPAQPVIQRVKLAGPKDLEVETDDITEDGIKSSLLKNFEVVADILEQTSEGKNWEINKWVEDENSKFDNEAKKKLGLLVDAMLISQMPELRKKSKSGFPKIENAQVGEDSEKLKKYLQTWDEFYQESDRSKKLKLIEDWYSKGDKTRDHFEPIADQKYRQDILKLTLDNSVAPIGIIDNKDVLQALGHAEVTDGNYADNIGKKVLYIHDISSAPWNVWYVKGEDDSKKRGRSGAGTLLMVAFIRKSRELGCKGRLELTAWGSSSPFYHKLGFQGDPGMYLTEEKANEVDPQNEDDSKDENN